MRSVLAVGNSRLCRVQHQRCIQQCAERPNERADHPMADLRRQSGEPSLLAADQITKDNFNTAANRWRLKTDFLGPRPDTLYSATPLLVDRVLYTTAGMRRAAVALNAATGEMLWMHTEDEGVRGENAPRIGAGRGLAYWASANGADRRVIYVTPGLPDAGARCQDRSSDSVLRTRRRRRSEARRRSRRRISTRPSWV